MPNHRRPNPKISTVKVILIALIAFAITYMLGEIYITRANADPADITEVDRVLVNKYSVSICVALDTLPTKEGVSSVISTMTRLGTTAIDGFKVVAMSVAYVCPIHKPELQEFVNSLPSKADKNVGTVA